MISVRGLLISQHLLILLHNKQLTNQGQILRGRVLGPVQNAARIGQPSEGGSFIHSTTLQSTHWIHLGLITLRTLEPFGVHILSLPRQRVEAGKFIQKRL